MQALCAWRHMEHIRVFTYCVCFISFTDNFFPCLHYALSDLPSTTLINWANLVAITTTSVAFAKWENALTKYMRFMCNGRPWKLPSLTFIIDRSALPDTDIWCHQDPGGSSTHKQVLLHLHYLQFPSTKSPSFFSVQVCKKVWLVFSKCLENSSD